MDARFYNSEDIDIDRLASDLVTAYQSQGYRAQQIGSRDQVLVQIKKGGDFEAVLGMQAALTISIQRTAGGVLAMLGQQRWIDKAAVGAVGLAAFFLLWPLAVTAGVGAVRQASLGNQALNMVDGLVRQQRPDINLGPLPPQVMFQVQQQWERLPPPQGSPYYVPPDQVSVIPQPGPAFPPALPSFSGKLRCNQCNTLYEAGDTFCSGCGRPLTERKVYCPNCNSELKPGLSFCSKCGNSTFTATSRERTEREAPTYTPPAPVMPQSQTYYIPSQPVNEDQTVAASNPPRAQSFPETPVYTPPPPQPSPQPYYTPPAQQAPDHRAQSGDSSVRTAASARPTGQGGEPPTQYYVPPAPQEKPPTPIYTPLPAVPPAQEKPPIEVYVPPVTQEPRVVPQPKVTIIQSTPRQEPPPPKPRPQKQYYIPSDQAQQAAAPSKPAEAIYTTPTVISSPSQKPETRPASQATGPWGSLTFSNGQKIQLSGERAIVGRYDHDLKGIPPEVDLAPMVGADTVSRIHAVLEHISDTYTLTDLNSTNATRLNNKRLEPDKPTPITTGDTIQFGKITCTFEKL